MATTFPYTEFPFKVQTYESATDTWSVTEFESKGDFLAFAQSQIKFPGKYNLKGTKHWRTEATREQEKGYFTPYVKGSHGYNKYWDNEKDKVVNGVIIDGFYLPGFYYLYINFLKIYDKKSKKLKHPTIWDSDYHFFLYILMCILKGKHAVVVKTRQRGYSYKIAAILYWSYMWFESSINTIGASDIAYVRKTWEFINQYRNYLNTKTAWRRGPNIPKALDWTERNMTADGDYYGLSSVLLGVTFQQSPTKGVGGAQSVFYYEEAGIAPTLLDTVEYIKPAITAGDEASGLIIVSGSVGQLDHCKHLKELCERPEANGFLGVDNVWEPDSTFKKVGFFVPDTWNLQGFIDDEGNSLIDKALAFIQARRAVSKQGKKGDKYQLEVSQSPLTISEAFDFRKNSYFKQWVVQRHQDNLALGKAKITSVMLFEDKDGKVAWRATNEDDPRPIEHYPLPPEVEDKRGCIQILEMPDVTAPFFTYFAGVDPVATDKTTTSESLFSVTIFKSMTEVEYTDEETGDKKKRITGFKPVAWYTGRYDDLKQTNEVGEFLIRFYNAFTAVESNVQTFINHMQTRGMQRYLATKKEIGFLDDLNANQNVHKQYGLHMTPTIKEYILHNIKEYVEEETDYIRKPSGEIVKVVYGVERISDNVLLEEIKQYRDGANTDRMIGFGLALSLCKYFVINGVFTKKSEVKDQKPIDRPTPIKSYFKTLGADLNVLPGMAKSFFKNRY